MNRVFVSGIGFASSIGTSRAEVLASLRDLRHGFVLRQMAGEGVGPELVCGSVDDFAVEGVDSQDWSFPGSAEYERGFLRGLPPHGPFALVALEEALGQATLSSEDRKNGRTGLFCASAGSSRLLQHHLNHMAGTDWRRINPKAIVSSISGTLNFNLGAHYGITGANCGFVSACASSSHAIGYGFDEIALGRQDRMLIVGAEDGGAESLLPFLGMRALSENRDPASASRPFDTQRDGFVGTPGGSAIVLESESSLEKRGVTPLAEMLSWGQASDGYSVAVPHPEGIGIRSATEQCLKAAKVGAGAIDWVNAHATSTQAGDRAEAIGLKSLGFGDRGTQTAISSTKGLTGHGLSYAGVLGAAISVLCLDAGIVPGNAALVNPDPACEGLNLPIKTESRDIRLVLNQSSGFGGSNVSHLFSRP